MLNDDDLKTPGVPGPPELPLREALTRRVPLSRIPPAITGADLDPYDEDSMVFPPAGMERLDSLVADAPARVINLGETLQLVRYSRRGNTLMITGLTPHGRRLAFEQRPDREGWYVVVAGRRRRPTERELALVVASITREMEASMVPSDESEVRSAYRLAVSWDQPGLHIRGLQAYRDLLLDEAAAFIAGQVDRLAVVAIELQAFKRFAIRHGHRVGQDFVRALGERLECLFKGTKKLHVCHKAGKSFRLIAVDRTSDEILELIAQITSDETRRWMVERVWGEERRTHPDEVNFYIGFTNARLSERKSTSYEALAQRLNDDAYRAAKLGQLKGHTSIQVAKSDYRTTVNQWRRSSEDELEELAAQMDDGPAEVMAEMCDYLHELVPADIEGMAVAGDVHALVHKAIARDGFWQGTTAMRIAGEELLARFLEGRRSPPGQNAHVGGFDLGDEFYGIVVDGERLTFAWGDLNSAGATRVRAGLERIQWAVGWRRPDSGGIVGQFLRALAPQQGPELVERIRRAAGECYAELSQHEDLRINDAVDIADYLWTPSGELVKTGDVAEGALLRLSLPRGSRPVRVLERRTNFIARLEIDGMEHLASVNDSFTGPYVKLRVRNATISAAICILQVERRELVELLASVREDNNLAEDAPMDVVGFLRHIADILLADQVKGPAKIELALGMTYDPTDFVKVYRLDEVRERHPGLFYEAVHQNLLEDHPLDIDRNLREMICATMLAQLRPDQRTDQRADARADGRADPPADPRADSRSDLPRRW